MQCFLGLLECADVANSALDAYYLATVIIFIMGIFGNPDFRAIAVAQPCFKMLLAAIINVKCMFQVVMIAVADIEVLDIIINNIVYFISKKQAD